MIVGMQYSAKRISFIAYSKKRKKQDPFSDPGAVYRQVLIKGFHYAGRRWKMSIWDVRLLLI